MEWFRLELKTRMPGNEAGFLYIEVLVALVILAFALLAIIPMFVLAAWANAASADLTFAATLANEKAEAFRAVAYDDLTAGTGEEIITMRLMRYRRFWEVEADTPHPGMKKVTVKVQPIRNAGSGLNRITKVSFYHAP